METVLITGGAGFVGSQTARQLVQAGQRVVLVDNFDPYYDVAIKRTNVAPLLTNPLVTLVESDVRDGPTMDRVVADFGVTRILHLAALAGVRASVEQGPEYVEVNVNGTVNILEAARKHGVSIVVHASTSSVYGEDSPIPFVETATADHPLAPYPASKRSAELLGHSYYHLFGTPFTALRFFNVYGPQGRPDMMPLRVMDALVHGHEIPLFDGGRMKRDWTYIDDIVKGIMTALERPMGYEVINLGFGAPFTMIEFIDILQELSGRKVLIRDTPAPASDPPITYCDNTKARRLLDFDPQVSLPEGLAQTWAWYNREKAQNPA